MIWKCSQYAFDTRMPIIMGILNMTPDSFSDGGTFNSFQKAMDHAHEMIEDGALIIDVGGESTRSGSAPVSCEEEISRVIDVVRALAEEGVCVSIDTRHAPVAQAAVEAGATIINDVSGFRDPAMVEVAKNCDAGLVVMHMQGEPATMQDDPQYNDVVNDVYDALKARCAELEEAGIAHNRICIDPGPGFGKTKKQTVELMRNLHEFRHMGYPVMVAASRKSYVGYVHGVAHSLGGQYGIAHGLANAVICPYVLEMYGESCQKRLGKLARHAGIAAAGTSDAESCRLFIEWFKWLNAYMGIPSYFDEIRDEDIPAMAKKAAVESNPLYPVPKLMNTTELQEIYHRVQHRPGENDTWRVNVTDEQEQVWR